MGIKVELNPSEILTAALIGVRRQSQNIYYKRKHAYNAPPNTAWQNHVEGALGENAVAKHYKIYWTGALGDLKAADVGVLQVRTAWHHKLRLILHKEDGDKEPFILVTGLNGSYQIQGWIFAVDGKKDEYWENPTKKEGKYARWAYFVPHEVLRSMDELKFER